MSPKFRSHTISLGKTIRRQSYGVKLCSNGLLERHRASRGEKSETSGRDSLTTLFDARRSRCGNRGPHDLGGWALHLFRINRGNVIGIGMASFNRGVSILRRRKRLRVQLDVILDGEMGAIDIVARH